MAEVAWEQGSYFHQLDSPQGTRTRAVPAKALLFTSGRAALAALVRHRGWRRVWLPTYSCPEVVEALPGVTLGFYQDTPFDAPPSPPLACEDEAVVVVNYFGCRARRDYAAFHDLPAAVIEDHTHDPWCPWATASRALYVFASLRKTLPVPDGGAVWSPGNASLPARPGNAAQAAAVMMTGMTLKRAYLDGANVSKEAFLSAFREAEQIFGVELEHGAAESTRVLIDSFPVERWREQRRCNHAVLAQELEGFELLLPREAAACPYSLVMLMPDCDARERLRRYLVERAIYPAVLWPLEERHRSWAGDRAMDVSARILSIHCDGRYGFEDMQRVASALRRFQQKSGTTASVGSARVL